MISGIYTGILLLLFIGIVIWAWSKKNKKTFEEMAHMPLQETNDDNNNKEVNDE